MFSNGYLDPWSGGGVNTLPFDHPSIFTIHIKEGAHHYDLRGADPLDTQEIKVSIQDNLAAFIGLNN